jgi:TRAP-type C4-dicarboxylate transport system substrate-binding protein
MDIQLEKIELMKLLKETENPTVIKAIKNIFQSEKKDWWNELTEEQQNILNESMDEYERGEFSSFDDFIKPHLK